MNPAKTIDKLHARTIAGRIKKIIIEWKIASSKMSQQFTENKKIKEKKRRDRNTMLSPQSKL
jgi:hypothetical protein